MPKPPKNVFVVSSDMNPAVPAVQLAVPSTLGPKPPRKVTVVSSDLNPAVPVGISVQKK